MIIDNPVYCGKIAFGRRVREKVKGTKNEYKQVPQEDYIIAEGQHEAIISEELWNAAHGKRELTGVKSPSKIGRDRAHLLSGILKCPKCGGPMYTNKHAWTNKDGTYKEVYYYVCSKARAARGKTCEYKTMLKKTDIEPLVIEAIRELIQNQGFAGEIKSRIGHSFGDESSEQTVVALVLRTFPRGVWVGEVDLRPPGFHLSEVSKLTAVVHGNGLKDLCEVVCVLVVKAVHGSHHGPAGLGWDA